MSKNLERFVLTDPKIGKLDYIGPIGICKLCKGDIKSGDILLPENYDPKVKQSYTISTDVDRSSNRSYVTCESLA